MKEYEVIYKNIRGHTDNMFIEAENRSEAIYNCKMNPLIIEIIKVMELKE